MPCGLGHPLADASEGRRSVDGRVCFGRGGCRGPARERFAYPLRPSGDAPEPAVSARREPSGQYILRPTLGLRSEGLESKAIDKAVCSSRLPALPLPRRSTRLAVESVESCRRHVECRRIVSLSVSLHALSPSLSHCLSLRRSTWTLQAAALRLLVAGCQSWSSRGSESEPR